MVRVYACVRVDVQVLNCNLVITFSLKLSVDDILFVFWGKKRAMRYVAGLKVPSGQGRGAVGGGEFEPVE